MPLPVVPILPLPLLSRRASRARSTSTWKGRISGQAYEDKIVALIQAANTRIDEFEAIAKPRRAQAEMTAINGLRAFVLNAEITLGSTNALVPLSSKIFCHSTWAAGCSAKCRTHCRTVLPSKRSANGSNATIKAIMTTVGPAIPIASKPRFVDLFNLPGWGRHFPNSKS